MNTFVDIVNKMIISGCFIGITVSAADMLKPSDKFANNIRLVFACVFILVLFTPLLSGRFNFSEDLNADCMANAYTDDIEKGVNSEMKSIVEKNLEDTVKQKLNEANINYEEISVIVNIEEDYSIDISGVYITGGYSEKSEEVIKDALGKNVNVYEGEANEFHNENE